MSEQDKALRAAPRRAMVEFGIGYGQVRHADDPAYSDARIPLCHASTHAARGPDPIDPASIGAAATEHKHDHRDLRGVAAEKHTHEVEDLRGAAAEKHRHDHLDLDGVAPARHSHRHEELAGVAAEKHRHDHADLSGVAPTKHTHSADDIVEGLFDIERIVASSQSGALLRVSADGKRLELVDPIELISPEFVARIQELLNG